MEKNNHIIKLMLDDVGNFLAKFTEQSEHVYWISSHDFTHIQYISPSYERIWGRPREELYFNPDLWITFLHPDDAISHHPIYQMAEKIKLLGEKARYSENYRIIRPNGEIRWFMDNGFPLYDENGICFGVTGLAIDVTEQKNAEIVLKIAKEAAESANRAKTAFIANMSHDIRTPLSGIVGLSALLEDSVQHPEQKQYAHWINESGGQLLGLLNGILDVVSAENVREDDLHEESFDLSQCIRDIVQLELPTTKLKHLDLRFEINEDVPAYIISDRTKIHRILLNFLGNAIKFTDAGHITIKVTCQAIDNHRAQLQFSVADTGIGIPLELQDSVFDRFYRASPSYKGTYTGHGVGLHIAQSYAKLLNGDITLTSQEGVGTTFYFNLSCKIGVDTAERINTTSSTLCPSNKKSPYILLVEDNPIAMKIVKSIVATAGCQLDAAVDGKQALELATSKTFDLIITDIGLPGISGHEFTRQFRTWETTRPQKPIPIIGLTAHARETAMKECLDCGMNDVFSKPMTPQMMQAIKEKYINL